ncbi:MAG: peptigoglycan-binding protein LysM, partial [Rhodopirellula bahusiensis]
MTTPPDALPPEVARDLIVDADTFDISDGIPETLGTLDPLAEFGIDDGTVSDVNSFAESDQVINDAANGDFNDLDMALNESNPDDGLGASSDQMSMDSVNRSFADIPSQSSSATDNLGTESSSFSMSDLEAGAGDLQASRLPEVTPGSSTPIQLDPNQEYTSTGSTYQSPDPNDAVASVKASTKSATDAVATESNAIASAGLSNAIATADRQYHSDRRREALAT